MKKLSLCIGVFVVLFLMMDLYMAQAQVDLTAYDGLWLKNSTKLRNMIYAGADGSTTIPERGPNEAYREYTCMSVDDANPGIINLSVYNRYGEYMLYGYLSWLSGTNEDFLGSVVFYTDNNYEYDFAYVTVEYGYYFTAVPGYGYYSDGTVFDTWDFLWSGKIPGRIPYDLGTVCCGFTCTTQAVQKISPVQGRHQRAAGR